MQRYPRPSRKPVQVPTRRRPGRPAGPPPAPPRRLPGRLGALAACLVVAGGAYLLVLPAAKGVWTERSEASSVVALTSGAASDGEPAAAPNGSAARPAEPHELPPRKLAAAARRSVVTLEGAGGPLGTGFVAWIDDGRTYKTYVLTAHRAVDGFLADRYGKLVVRRGQKAWRARPAGDDRLAGLTLLRVRPEVPRPLWPDPAAPAPLRDGDEVLVVAGGAPPVRAEVAITDTIVQLQTGFGHLYLGAPVLARTGELLGLVTATTFAGTSRISPIHEVCSTLRSC